MSDDQLSLARVEFRGNESRWEALFYLVFGLGVVWICASQGGWTAIVGCIAFGTVFLILMFHKAFGELDRSVKLCVDDEGLTMPLAFRQRIPWSAITGYSFDQNDERVALVVHIDNPRRYEPRTENPLATWVSTWSGARLPLHDIDGDTDTIEDAFRRFAPHLRRV